MIRIRRLVGEFVAGGKSAHEVWLSTRSNDSCLLSRSPGASVGNGAEVSGLSFADSGDDSEFEVDSSRAISEPSSSAAEVNFGSGSEVVSSVSN